MEGSGARPGEDYSPQESSDPIDPGVTVKARVEAQENKDDETVLRTAGQRRVNLIWEVTQSVIALSTIGSSLIIMTNNSIKGITAEIPTTLSSMIFLVIGFYFARTNHTNTGGIGPTHFPFQRR